MAAITKKLIACGIFAVVTAAQVTAFAAQPSSFDPNEIPDPQALVAYKNAVLVLLVGAAGARDSGKSQAIRDDRANN